LRRVAGGGACVSLSPSPPLPQSAPRPERIVRAFADARISDPRARQLTPRGEREAERRIRRSCASMRPRHSCVHAHQKEAPEPHRDSGAGFAAKTRCQGLG
jgi:hypothetical protein